MAIKANLVLDQGTDFAAIIDVTDVDGNVYDLTDYAIAGQMRKNYASSTAITFVASHNGSAGQISLSLTSNETVDLEPGRYMYDVEMRSSANTVTRVVEGIVTVTPGITRI